MLYITLHPSQAEPFQEAMKAQDWKLVLQDGGQSQFIGWAYIMRWEKVAGEKTAEVCLHYSDNQGELEAYLEMNVVAKPLMDKLVESLPKFEEGSA